MAKKSIKLNYLYNLSYQILLLITPLITTPYVSRVLGADGIGIYSFTYSVVSYFTLFASLGVPAYGQREISYVQDNRKKRNKVFWETKLLSLYSTLASILLYVFFVKFIVSNHHMIYLVLAFNIINTLADVSWFFQGMEEFGRIVLRNVVFKLINILFIFAFVKQKEDLVIYVFGIVFLQFLSSLSLWGYLPRFIDRPNLNELKPFHILGTVLALFIPTIAIQIYTMLDKTMIGLLTESSYENGYYEQALKMSRLVLTLVTALGTVMIPRLGYYFEKGETEKVKDLMYNGYRFVWFLGVPLCFGLIGIASNFVPWFYGEGYDKVIGLLRISGFLILAIGINNVTGMQYLIPTKRQNIFTITVMAGAATNLIMNMVLIPFLYAQGAMIASVFSESIIAILQIFIIRRELEPWKIIRCSVTYWIAGVCMIVILWVEGRLFPPSYVYTIVMIISGVCVYFFGLLTMKDEFLNKILSQIKK